MLYVDVRDVYKAFEIYALNILRGEVRKGENSLAHIVNVYYPRSITILDLAEIVKKAIIKCTDGKLKPKVEILDKGVPILFDEDDKNRIRVDIEKAKRLLRLEKLRSPEESLMEIIKLQLE